jgi:5'-nucleotidase
LRILLSNDDGIDSLGIETLAKILSVKHEVIVAAPAFEQSGMSQAITVFKRMSVESYKMPGCDIEAWKINGTPADCIKVYLEAIDTVEKPDLLISGINKGSNLGTDVLYSGTVGAAIEGYIHGISSIALSLDAKSTTPLVSVSQMVGEKLPDWFNLEKDAFLYNINFPKQNNRELDPFVFTKLGVRNYKNAFNRILEDGRIFYQMAGEISDGDNAEVTDIFATNRGYVSITPLQLDLTDYTRLEDKLYR